MASFVCIACGENFGRRPSKLGAGYCSHECYLRNSSFSWASENAKKITKEERARRGMVLSERLKDKTKHPFWGKSHSEDSKKMISASRSGIPWSVSRREAHEISRTKKRTRVKKRNNGVVVGVREYPASWSVVRKTIYKRDNYLCQECGVHCHGNGTKDKIQCHHIDYNIDNINDDNLITLCASCHMKTNFKRDDWTEHFKSMERE
jgi:5-methylcytosine-specific restriction endonuclease McrA